MLQYYAYTKFSNYDERNQFVMRHLTGTRQLIVTEPHTEPQEITPQVIEDFLKYMGQNPNYKAMQVNPMLAVM
jgi:hypothetical protein